MLNKQFFWRFLAGTAVVYGVAIFTPPSNAQGPNFVCTTDEQNIPTTYAETPEGAVEVFKWKSNYFKPPYTPMQRCQEVSQRMNDFQPEYLVSGRVNNQNVICAGQSCNSNGSNVLLTLRPDQNPNQVLEEIDQNRDGAGGPSMQLGSGSKKGRGRGSNLQKTANGFLTLDLKRYVQTAPRIPKYVSGNTSSESDYGNSPDSQPSSGYLLDYQEPTPASTAKPGKKKSSKGQRW